MGNTGGNGDKRYHIKPHFSSNDYTSELHPHAFFTIVSRFSPFVVNGLTNSAAFFHVIIPVKLE